MELLNHKIIGEGKPLIILHGFLGSLDNWLTLGKKFAENRKVILVDQRNHGKSFHNNKFRYDEMVEDLEKLIHHLALEKPVLLGHSMGGKTVMQYAAYHEPEIDKLIVADIGPKAYPTHHDQILNGLNSIPISTIASRQEADNTLAKYVSDPNIRVFLLKNLQRSSEGFSWKMNLPVLMDNIGNIGDEINHHVPINIDTLFIRGENSNYILDEDWEEIQNIFPESNLETIEQAGHWLHAEQPDVFYQIVSKFIS